MRKTLFVLLICMLAACAPLATDSPALPSYLVISTSIPKEKLSPVPTWRALFPPTSTKTPVHPTATQLILPASTPTDPGCLQLTEPSAGASIYQDQEVILRWEKLPDVETYVVLLSLPGGLREKIQVSGTELVLDLQAGKDPIPYLWSVQAYDADNRLLCYSGSLPFTHYPGRRPSPTETTTASPEVEQTQSPVP